MRVAAIQMAPDPNFQVNKDKICNLVADAAARGASLVVLPEEAMLRADESKKSEFQSRASKAWPEFEQILADLSSGNKVTIIAGGYEPRQDGQLPYNTLLAFDAGGRETARYRKIHLYDAFAYRESDYVSFGDELPPVINVEGLRIGIANCYDLRFPELFRYLSDREVDVLALSAAWVVGKGKEEHWAVLTQARALENVCWMIAAATAGTDTVGLSRIIDPLGVIVASANGRDETVIVTDIDKDSIARSRELLPAIANRRLRTAYSMES